MPEGGGGVKTRLTGPALGLAAVGLVLLFVFTTELYRQFELKTLDFRFRTRPALAQSPKILHVDIDDSSIESFGRFNSWPRAYHGHLVRILKELGAREVVFDIEFTEPSTPADDNALAAALRETDFNLLPFRLFLKPPQSEEERDIETRMRAVLPEQFDIRDAELAEKLEVPKKAVENRGISLKNSVARELGWEILQKTGHLTVKTLLKRLLPHDNPYTETKEEKIIPPAVDHALARRRVYEVSAKPITQTDRTGAVKEADEISPPIYKFTAGCVGFGASNTNPDDEDGVVRHVSLFFRKDGRLLPHLSLSSACRLLGIAIEDVEVVPGRYVALHPGNDLAGGDAVIRIPVDERCRTIVDWAGSRGMAWSEVFDHVPYGSFLELHVLRQNMRDNDGNLHKIYRYVAGFITGSGWTKIDEKITKLRSGESLSAAEEDTLNQLTEARRKEEEGLRLFLERQCAKISDEELKSLPADDEFRKEAEAMKYYLAGILSLRAEQQNLAGEARDLRNRLAQLVRGRLCLIGSTESGSSDLKNTPIHPSFPGVGVHSAVINSILQRAFIRRAPTWVDVLSVVLVGLIVSLIASGMSSRWASLGSFGVLVGWGFITYFAFWLYGWWLASAGPIIAGFLAFATITVYRQLTEERQKRHVRNTFQHYLSPSVVEEVLKNPDALKLGGERKDLTVFFSDVAGFTPISEQLEPEELVMLLNDYLSEMSDVILDANGYINKYVGDGIMAVFGAPLPDPEHARVACRVALESQRRLKDFREKLTREQRPIIRARIGINSGVMVVGNMGSRKLFDYTVMGDNVNVGARLESASKHFGTEIIIGEDTFKAVGDAFETRRLGMVSVKGRSRPVGAYELLAEKGKCPPIVAKMLPHYTEGLAAYAEQRWDTAVAAFNEALKVNPNDGPSRAYLNRCNLLREQTAAEHWDGTFTLETK